MTQSSLYSARMEILETCAKSHAGDPLNDWATWDRAADNAGYDLNEHAAHSLENEDLIEVKFLIPGGVFTARTKWKGSEYLKARGQQSATPGTSVAFLDTNVLLHSIPLEQIVWTEVLQAKEVKLVVCSAVAEELEKRKYDPQRWLRDRAARAGAELQGIVGRGNRVREGVTLRFEERELNGPDLKLFQLIWERGDDRVLGCALACGDRAESVIVSWDNIFLSRAQTKGFRAHRLDDKYKLPAAPDPVEIENKRLKSEGRLVLQAERITATKGLWAAFCEFERRVEVAVSPFSMLPQPKGETWDDRQKDSERLVRQDHAARNAAVGEAWQILKEARDQAECILDERTFAAFDALYQEYDAAHRDVWVARTMNDHRELALATKAAREKLRDVKEQRAAVLYTIRGMIAGAGKG